MYVFAVLDQIRRCNNWKSFKRIHARILTTGLVHDPSVSNQVVDYFAKHVALIDYACDYLRHVDWRRSSFPFNALVSGYARSNVPRSGFLVYRNILRVGFVADDFTFTAVLKSCTKFHGVGEGSQIHDTLVKIGSSRNVYALSSLLSFYGGFGDCRSARKVFDEMPVRDSVTWTCMISVYAKTGWFDEAVELFSIMDVQRDTECFVGAVTACGRKGYLNFGKVIHGALFKLSSEKTTPLILGNAVVDMYMRCGSHEEARRVFEEIPEKDVVSWNIMISGLLRCGLPKESLETFWEMRLKPDEAVLTSALSACAALGTISSGRSLIRHFIDDVARFDVGIGTAVVDMYFKCGCIEEASKAFDELPHRNVVTWNALIGGLALNGGGREAIRRFEEMEISGEKPNAVTLLAILMACSHSGLVDEGRRFFRRIPNQNRGLEHYGCMVDLFCRAGFLDEAHELVSAMPIKPDRLIWGSLLTASNAAGDIELSREISDRVLALEAHDSGAYVLLSNVYASNENWVDVMRLRRVMRSKGIRKLPGSSAVEIDCVAHEFLAGDTNHPQNDEVCRLLALLANQVCV